MVTKKRKGTDEPPEKSNFKDVLKTLVYFFRFAIEMIHYLK